LIYYFMVQRESKNLWVFDFWMLIVKFRCAVCNGSLILCVQSQIWIPEQFLTSRTSRLQML
jgi:hypothetical protein